jgi:hypothetical protein
MNKSKLFLSFWVANVVALFSIIVVPKKPEFYSILSLLTIFLIFVVPLILVVSQGYLTVTSKECLEMSSCIPNAGCSLVILLTFVKFIGSIEKIGRTQMVTILLVFVVLELLLGYLKIENKEMTKKQFILTEIATYMSLVIFFFCAMVMSFDFGII